MYGGLQVTHRIHKLPTSHVLVAKNSGQVCCDVNKRNTKLYNNISTLVDFNLGIVEHSSAIQALNVNKRFAYSMSE